MKKLLLVFLFSLELLAGNLSLQNGSIAAHTEMLMDSTINPSSKNLSAELTIKGTDITSLSGKLWLELNSFVSDNTERDEHMYESLNINKFQVTSYKITSVEKTNEENMYNINGLLSLHGIEKKLSAKAKISFKDEKLNFHATSTIMFPHHGIEMPCMMFLCVSDQVDIVIEATFSH